MQLCAECPRELLLMEPALPCRRPALLQGLCDQEKAPGREGVTCELGSYFLAPSCPGHGAGRGLLEHLLRWSSCQRGERPGGCL